MGEFAFGLRELKVTDSGGQGAVALPASLLLHVTERIEAEEFWSEGTLIGVAALTTAVEWELESGGIPLGAWSLLTGRTRTVSGLGSGQTVSLSAAQGIAFPAVRIYGRALAAEGGDVHCKIYEAVLTAIEGTFRVGEFWVTSCAGVAIGQGGRFYEFAQHVTARAI